MSPTKRKYRQRLLRQVRTAEPRRLAREVLTLSRFRKGFLFEEYLARCEHLISTAPREALVVAEAAPEYARLTALEEGRPDDCLWEARAWAVLGSAYRATGEYPKAERAFKSAAEDLKGNKDEIHSLMCRVAVMRSEQRRHKQALDLADKSVAYFAKRYDPTRKLNEIDNYSLASSLAIRGFTRCQAHAQGEDFDITLAALDYVSALKVCTARTPRTRFNALKSLISLLCLGWLGSDYQIGLSPSDVDRGFDRLLECIKETDGRRSLSYAQALWIRATARARIAGSMMVPRAECLFVESRELLDRLGQWENFAHISVEMAWWYVQSGDWPKAKRVLTPLLSDERATRYPTHWYSAIEAWVKTESLEAAAKTLATVRDCTVTVPEKDDATRSKGRWSSGGLW